MYMNGKGEADDHLAHAMCRIGMAIANDEMSESNNIEKFLRLHYDER